MATIEKNNEEPTRYSTHDVGNGLKLMEHSYIENNYVERIMSMLKKPANLSWVCDYSDDHPWSWDKTTEATKSEFLKDSDELNTTKYFILNHDKQLFIDIDALFKIEKQHKVDSWPIHPIPILCNSSDQSLGGGDYHPEDSRRNTWDMDSIQIVFNTIDIPDNYGNATEDCAFYE